MKKIRQTLYKLKKRYWPKAIILCYHRVGDYSSDPNDITVSKKFFSLQIQWLRNHFNLISLDELANCMEEYKSPPRNAIILTFDDGYASTIGTMKFLDNRNVPATFFICTPNSGNSHFYWDILSYLLIERQEIPDDDMDFILQLCNLSNINLRPEKRLSEGEFRIGLKWNRHNKNYSTNRCKILELLTNKAEYENPNSHNSILNLLNQKRSPIESERSFNLNIDKLNLKHCNIGAHTMNHYTLSSLNKLEQEKEIIENKIQLESIIGKKIKYFAYPFGSRQHYNEHSLEIVKENFNLALSNFQGMVHKNTNPFELPRYLIRNWDLGVFKEKIRDIYAES